VEPEPSFSGAGAKGHFLKNGVTHFPNLIAFETQSLKWHFRDIPAIVTIYLVITAQFSKIRLLASCLWQPIYSSLREVESIRKELRPFRCLPPDVIEYLSAIYSSPVWSKNEKNRSRKFRVCVPSELASSRHVFKPIVCIFFFSKFCTRQMKYSISTDNRL